MLVGGRDFELSVLHLSLCEVPGVGREGDARVALTLPHGKAGRIAVHHRVGLDIDAAFGAGADTHREDARPVGDELLTHRATQTPAVLHRLRQEGNDVGASVDQVALPAAPDHGVAVALQKALPSELRLRQVQAGGVAIAEGGATAAVGELVKHLVAASAEVNRLDDVEDAGELDAAITVKRRQVEVADVREVWLIRVDGEVRLAEQPLVGTGTVKLDAAGEALPALNLQANRVAHDGLQTR